MSEAIANLIAYSELKSGLVTGTAIDRDIIKRQVAAMHLRMEKETMAKVERTAKVIEETNRLYEKSVRKNNPEPKPRKTKKVVVSKDRRKHLALMREGVISDRDAKAAGIKKFTPAEKLEMVNAAAELRSQGQQYNKIAEGFGIAAGTLRLWIRQAGLSKEELEKTKLKIIKPSKVGYDIHMIHQVKAALNGSGKTLNKVTREMGLDRRELYKLMDYKGYKYNKLTKEIKYAGVRPKCSGPAKTYLTGNPDTAEDEKRAIANRAVELHEKGMRYRDVAAYLGVPIKALYKWIKEYNPQQDEEDKRRISSNKRIRAINMINEILESGQCENITQAMRHTLTNSNTFARYLEIEGYKYDAKNKKIINLIDSTN